MHSEDQNVHLVTQMIWGRTTHMGCGWIQFPVEAGSKKFEKIYPEGEFENFFVCNYGVGGNVPGEPVYSTDCKEEETELKKEEETIIEINEKLEEILQDSHPNQRKILQICLDALICLHDNTNSCLDQEEKCIKSLNEEQTVVNEESYLSSPIEKRIEMLQCTTESFLCSIKDKEECQAKLQNCFSSTTDLLGKESVPETTTTESSTSSRSSVTVTTVRQPITIAKESSLAPDESSSSSIMSGSSTFEFDVTTASFHNFDLEITTLRPSSGSTVSNLRDNQSKEGTTLPSGTNLNTSSSSSLPSTSAIDSTEELSILDAMVRDFEELPFSTMPKEKELVQVCINALLCLHSTDKEMTCTDIEQKCVENINSDKQSLDFGSYISKSEEERATILNCFTDAKLCNLKQNLDCQVILNECLGEQSFIESITESSSVSKETQGSTATTQSTFNSGIEADISSSSKPESLETESKQSDNTSIKPSTERANTAQSIEETKSKEAVTIAEDLISLDIDRLPIDKNEENTTPAITTSSSSTFTKFNQPVSQTQVVGIEQTEGTKKSVKNLIMKIKILQKIPNLHLQLKQKHQATWEVQQWYQKRLLMKKNQLKHPKSPQRVRLIQKIKRKFL